MNIPAIKVCDEWLNSIKEGNIERMTNLARKFPPPLNTKGIMYLWQKINIFAVFGLNLMNSMIKKFSFLLSPKT